MQHKGLDPKSMSEDDQNNYIYAILTEPQTTFKYEPKNNTNDALSMLSTYKFMYSGGTNVSHEDQEKCELNHAFKRGWC